MSRLGIGGSVCVDNGGVGGCQAYWVSKDADCNTVQGPLLCVFCASLSADVWMCLDVCVSIARRGNGLTEFKKTQTWIISGLSLFRPLFHIPGESLLHVWRPLLLRSSKEWVVAYFNIAPSKRFQVFRPHVSWLKQQNKIIICLHLAYGFFRFYMPENDCLWIILTFWYLCISHASLVWSPLFTLNCRSVHERFGVHFPLTRSESSEARWYCLCLCYSVTCLHSEPLTLKREVGAKKSIGRLTHAHWVALGLISLLNTHLVIE